MKVRQSKAWFAPKRYGYGSGLPVAWEGWVVLVGYIAVVIGGVCLVPLVVQGTAAIISTVIGIDAVATIALLIICARTTEGGWRWRWGDQD